MLKKDMFVILTLPILFIMPQIFSQTKVFWSDSSNVLRSADLDGSNIQTIVSGVGHINDMVVDTNSGHIYYGNETTNTISRVDLDGSNLTNLVSGVNTLHGIELDLTNGHMYFSDAGAGVIQRANLDGSNVTNITSTNSTPRDIELDLVNGKIYYTETNSVRRANLDGSNIEVLKSTASAYGLALDVGSNHLYYTERGTFNGIIGDRLVRTNLDGSNVSTLITNTHLTNPEDIEIDLNAGKIYIAGGSTNVIHRANLDGSGLVSILGGQNFPSGLALDEALTTTSAVPEPSTYALTFIALSMLYLRRKRK